MILGFGSPAKCPEAFLVQFDQRGLHQLPPAVEMVKHRAARQAGFERNLGRGGLGIAVFDQTPNRCVDQAGAGLGTLHSLQGGLGAIVLHPVFHPVSA